MFQVIRRLWRNLCVVLGISFCCWGTMGASTAKSPFLIAPAELREKINKLDPVATRFLIKTFVLEVKFILTQLAAVSAAEMEENYLDKNFDQAVKALYKKVKKQRLFLQQFPVKDAYTVAQWFDTELATKSPYFSLVSLLSFLKLERAVQKARRELFEAGVVLLEYFAKLPPDEKKEAESLVLKYYGTMSIKKSLTATVPIKGRIVNGTTMAIQRLKNRRSGDDYESFEVEGNPMAPATLLFSGGKALTESYAFYPFKESEYDSVSSKALRSWKWLFSKVGDCIKDVNTSNAYMLDLSSYFRLFRKFQDHLSQFKTALFVFGPALKNFMKEGLPSLLTYAKALELLSLHLDELGKKTSLPQNALDDQKNAEIYVKSLYQLAIPEVVNQLVFVQNTIDASRRLAGGSSKNKKNISDVKEGLKVLLSKFPEGLLHHSIFGDLFDEVKMIINPAVMKSTFGEMKNPAEDAFFSRLMRFCCFDMFFYKLGESWEKKCNLHTHYYAWIQQDFTLKKIEENNDYIKEKEQLFFRVQAGDELVVSQVLEKKQPEDEKNEKIELITKVKKKKKSSPQKITTTTSKKKSNEAVITPEVAEVATYLKTAVDKLFYCKAKLPAKDDFAVFLKGWRNKQDDPCKALFIVKLMPTNNQDNKLRLNLDFVESGNEEELEKIETKKNSDLFHLAGWHVLKNKECFLHASINHAKKVEKGFWNALCDELHLDQSRVQDTVVVYLPGIIYASRYAENEFKRLKNKKEEVASLFDTPKKRMREGYFVGLFADASCTFPYTLRHFCFSPFKNG